MFSVSPKVFAQLHKIPHLEDGKRGKQALSTQPGWFYLRLLTSLNSSYQKYLENNRIFLNCNNKVDNGWYKDYFDEKQITFINENPIISIFPISKKYKLSKNLLSIEPQDRYLVEATAGWEPKEPNVKFTHLAKNFFVLSNNAKTSLLIDDPKVASINRFPARILRNRFTSGAVQSGDLEGKQFINGILVTERSMHDKGLNGEGEIITVVDSGVDRYHPFFYDPDHDVTIGTNITNRAKSQHRKIEHIFNFADDRDIRYGHGTHVAGTALGEAYCNNCSISLYNGIAPKSRLILADIGYINEGTAMSGDFDLEILTQDQIALGSYISSNSWGADYMCDIMTWMYDYVSIFYPEVTFLFAAGNSARALDLSCPSDSKNVIGVGGISKLWISNIQGTSASYKIVVEDQTFTASKLSRAPTIQTYNMEYFKGLTDLPISTDPNEDLTGKIFVCASGNSAEVSVALSNNAEAAIIPNTFNLYNSLSKVVVQVTKETIDKISKYSRATILQLPSPTESTQMTKASFSSYGPSNFNSYKPDIAVPGATIYSSAGGDPKVEQVRQTNWNGLTSKSGTSMATPAASGMTALIMQFFAEGWYPYMEKGKSQGFRPTSALVRAMMISSGRPISTISEYPNYKIGYGFAQLHNVFDFDNEYGGLRILDNIEIQPKSHHTYKIHVDNNRKPLVVTLAYIDFSYDYTYAAPLIFDLDLVVISPNGKEYYGNDKTEQFTANERVYIPESEIIPNSDYEITILSNAYPSDTPYANYSLVVTGDFIQKDFTKNPINLTKQDNSNSKLKCNNGELINGGCSCAQGYTGMRCTDKFQEVTFGQTMNSISFAQGEVKYYKTAIPPSVTCGGDNIPTLNINGINNNWVHVSFASFPFENLYDEGVSHYDSTNPGAIQTDCPAGGVVYYAIAITSSGSQTCSFTVKTAIPFPTRTPMDFETEIYRTPDPTRSPAPTEISYHNNITTAAPTESSTTSLKILTGVLAIGLVVVIVIIIIIVLLPRFYKSYKRRKTILDNNEEIKNKLVHEQSDDLDTIVV